MSMNAVERRARQAAAQRAFRARRSPEKRRADYEKYRAWLKAHPEKEFEYKCLRPHGLTLADYERMLIAQGSGCACCGAQVNKSGRRLGVDHDHRTGKVRGVLCHHCNAGIGHFEDDPARLRLAIAYLEKHRPTARRPSMRINLTEVEHVGTA